MSQQLGTLLQEWRRHRRLSLCALAAQAGLSKGTLSGWEQGRHQPRLPELEALFRALEVTLPQQREALALIDAPRARRSLAPAPPRPMPAWGRPPSRCRGTCGGRCACGGA
jgi:transcriptional regulator with XRE-family HTH domain